MFVRIDNTPRDYAWGSRTAIAELLGKEPSGSPEAELWLGAHAGSPARITDPSRTGGATTLADWIAADAGDATGEGHAAGAPRLTFLMKLLAADAPLSLQAHPTAEQAREGFDAENAAGLALDAPERNYKDPFHKPELVLAISDSFDALCGFRPLDEATRDLDLLIETGRSLDLPTEELQRFRRRLSTRTDAAQLTRDAVSWLLGDDAEGRVAALVAQTVDTAAAARGATDDAALRMDTIRMLAAAYPADPGVVISLLLHRVRLARGEALYLPAGNIHSYLAGLAVEVMAASDNVLRGGLTPKHIDVDQLLTVLEFAPLPVPYLKPHRIAAGIDAFRPDVPDFQLVHVQAFAIPESAPPALPLPGPAIALCISGAVAVRGATGSIRLERGDCAYITPDERAIEFDGDGELFLATTNP